MKPLIWLLFGALLCCHVMGHAQTPARTTRARPPQIWIDPALGKLEPIELQDVAIDIRMQGFVATTTIDLTFFNPNARVLEGELVFPLSADQAISGYALEVNGKLRRGVVVEKETARVAFEATTRRGIDPGLAELTRGNVFRTRLYPIPANGSKRVAISFDQPLLDAGSEFRYLLPLAFERKIRHFHVHAEAIRAERKPKTSADTDGLAFDRAHDSFVADLDRTDFQPPHELRFAIEKPSAAGTVFAVPDALEPAWRTFAAQVASAPPTDRAEPAPIRRVALFYDASGSARDRDRARELDFLDAWLAQIKNVDIDLVAFRNDADPAQHFHVRNGDGAALRHALETLPLDGGTSYGAIDLRAVERPDLALVVGDGLSNFAEREPRLAFADGRAPRVVFLHAARAFDSAAFAHWARRAGGQDIDLLAVTTDDALRRLGAAPWQMQGMRVVQGECTDLAPTAPAPAGAAFNLFGRCNGSAEIELTFGDATGRTLRRTLKIDDAASIDPSRGEFVARLWAVARSADLESAADPDEAAITALGKRYGVVTRNTSMLVLDRIEDYVRYRVEPREPELAAQYRQLLQAQPKDIGAAQKNERLLTQLHSWWADFKQWHAQRHPWLETVLAPAADAEIARWNGGVAGREADAGAKRARDIARRAHELQERWLRNGADPVQRKQWEEAATALMLELDTLRQQRLALAPDSDTIKAEPERVRIAQERSVRDGSADVRVQHAPPPPRYSTTEATARPAPMPAREAAVPMPAGAAPPADVAPREEAKIAGNLAPPAKPEAPAPTHARIELQEWDPNTPYLALLRAAKEPYASYLEARARFGKSPSFYLDSADYFRHVAKDPRLALRVLSNLAEIDTENGPLLRILAYRLEQWERFELAVPLFEDALKLRGEEPQSYRDLALALTRQPQADFARATQLLWKVASSEWDGRFPEIQTIALHELNDALLRAPLNERAALIERLEGQGLDPALREPVPIDLRVVLTWDADNTDIDLWVIDPTGDVAIYSQPRTRTGGRVSRDFTGGYGPEVFTIARPLPGTYTVKANYYGSRQQKIAGDVTVQVEFFTHFDGGESKREAVTRRLQDRKELIEVGRFVVEAK